MLIYFIAHEKLIASAEIEPESPLETIHEAIALPLSEPPLADLNFYHIQKSSGPSVLQG